MGPGQTLRSVLLPSTKDMPLIRVSTIANYVEMRRDYILIYIYNAFTDIYL